LAELTDAAYNFIQRENYEKALILLQKTEGVLEVSTALALPTCHQTFITSKTEENSLSIGDGLEFFKFVRICNRWWLLA